MMKRMLSWFLVLVLFTVCVAAETTAVCAEPVSDLEPLEGIDGSHELNLELSNGDGELQILFDDQVQILEDILGNNGIDPVDIPEEALLLDLPSESNEAIPIDSEQSYVTNDEDVLISDFYYYKIADGCAVITDVETRKEYNDSGKLVKQDKLQYVNVAIPETLGGCPVTKIGEKVFKDAKNLSQVTFPACLKEIGTQAFSGCESLPAVTFPAGLEMLGYSAFANCTALGSVNIPVNAKTGEYVGKTVYYGPFIGCSSLQDVSFDAGITEIQPGLFMECGLPEITIPEGVTEIGHDAFCRCKSLVQVSLPSSLIHIKSHAFADCAALTTVPLPAGLELLDYYAFGACTALTSINIPAHAMTGEYTTQTVYEGPFAKSMLAEVSFDPGISIIPKGMFHKCYNLMQITIPDTVETIKTGAFMDCLILGKVDIPQSVTVIEGKAFYNCTSLQDIQLPSGLTILSCDAFGKCTSLGSINIPAGMQTSDYCGANQYYPGPFAGCSGLKNVSFGEGILSIAPGLFYFCDGIETITLPATIEKIEGTAFCRCTSLKNIHIGENVVSIGGSAFSGCTALADVYYALSEETWNEIKIGGNNDPLLQATFHYNQGISSMTGAKVTVAKCTYTGKPLEPKVTVKVNGVKLTKDEDYSLEYMNNVEPGKGTAIIKGKRKYTGTIKKSFKIGVGNSYLVTFNGAGGKPSVSSIRVIPKKKYGTLPTAERKGYELVGWFTKKEGGKAVTEKTTVTAKKKHTLYAHWIKQYSIQYVLNKGINNPENPLFYTENTSTIKLKAPIRNGYIFEGWFTDGKFKDRIEKIPKGSTGNIILYAKWKKNETGGKKKYVYNLCIGSTPNSKPNILAVADALNRNKLEGYEIKPTNVCYSKNISRSFFDQWVKYTFAGTTSKDLSFVYICAHGKARRELTQDDEVIATGIGLDMTDGEYSYSQVLNTLANNISGQVILLTEVCYSGGFVEAAKSKSFKARDRFSVISAADIHHSSNSIIRTTNDFWVAALLCDMNNLGRYTNALVNQLNKFSVKLTINNLYERIRDDSKVKEAGQVVELYSSDKDQVIYQR